MTHKVDLIVERKSAENFFEASEKEYEEKNKRLQKGFLWKGSIGVVVALLFYGLTIYSKDWLVFGHVTLLVAAYFFCNFFISTYEYNLYLKSWKKQIAVFYETYKNSEIIRYEFNEEKISRIEKESVVKEVFWTEMKSYLIIEEGIYLFFEEDGQFRIPKMMASEEADYRRLEETTRTILTKQNTPLYTSPAAEAAYKKTPKEIFAYIFAPPVSWITLLFTAICIAIWIGISLLPENNWAGYNQWGFFSYVDILNGSYGGLITNAFVHIAIWHLLMNLYWLVIFGSKIEKEMGLVAYVILTLTSAAVSSAFQVIFSDATGIGFSGVLYAYFGFIMMAGLRSEKFKGYLDKSDIWSFLLWLLVCVFLTYTELLNIGNAAHTSGLIWGICVGIYFFYDGKKIVTIIAMAIILALASLPFVWAPWSVNWLATKAYDEHAKGNYEKARHYYELVLEKEPDNQWAKDNKKMLP